MILKLSSLQKILLFHKLALMLAYQLNNLLQKLLFLVEQFYFFLLLKILIQKVMSSVSNTVSLAKLDLEEIIPIIAACRFYIGNDSGPLHISANLGLKCLAIFCDSPPSAYGLWNSNIKIVVPVGKTIENTKHNTRGKHEISFDEILKKSLELIN